MGLSSCRQTRSGLPLILNYGELDNYFIIYYNVVIIETKCTINIMHLHCPKTIPVTQSVEKLSSIKLVPGTKKTGDCYVVLSIFDITANHMGILLSSLGWGYFSKFFLRSSDADATSPWTILKVASF